jgi:ubiquinone/menaquinone biosynthesis C-methylase UbiE
MSSDVPSATERKREHQRALWSTAAPAWQLDYATAVPPIDAITEQLLALAHIDLGQRVLDLSCGAGNPAFFIAQRVGSAGSLLGLDISTAMVQGTAEHAARLGISNATFRVIASESDLSVVDGAFDAATCRHGLMFMPDPLGALRALFAALKPDGRIAVSTWASLYQCPSFGVLIDALVRRAEPTPAQVDELTLAFTALPEPDTLVDLLNEAGFGEVEVTIVEQWHEPESAAAHWDHTTARFASMRALLAAQPEDVRAAIRADAVAALREQFGDGPIRLLVTALVAGGSR